MQFRAEMVVQTFPVVTSYRPYQVHTLFFYTRSYEPAFEMLALALTADLEGYLASRIVGSLATDWPVE